VALTWLWAEAAGSLMERWGRVGWRELMWLWLRAGAADPLLEPALALV